MNRERESTKVKAMGKQKKGLVSSQEEGDTKDNIKGGKRFMLRFELY